MKSSNILLLLTINVYDNLEIVSLRNSSQLNYTAYWNEPVTSKSDENQQLLIDTSNHNTNESTLNSSISSTSNQNASNVIHEERAL